MVTQMSIGGIGVLWQSLRNIESTLSLVCAKPEIAKHLYVAGKD